MSIKSKNLQPKVTLFDVSLFTLMIIIAFVTIYPFINTIAISFNNAIDSLRGGITFIPRKFTLENYRNLLSNKTIYSAAVVSVARTVTGVILHLFCTAMLAYTLSRKEFVLRKTISIIFLLTMYFSGGIIPTYFLMRSLGLLNTFWVYIIPGAISGFNLIVMRTFMEEVPDSFFESAKIDGAGDFKMFIKIMVPLSKPVLATIALFIGVGQWNRWFDTMLYNSARQQLSTLQYELIKIISNVSSSQGTKNVGSILAGHEVETVTPMSIQAAIIVIVIVPIMLVYPFLQKYFTVGITVGGIKE